MLSDSPAAQFIYNLRDRPGIDLRERGIPVTRDLDTPRLSGDVDFVRANSNQLVCDWLKALADDLEFKTASTYLKDSHSLHVTVLPMHLKPGQWPGAPQGFHSMLGPVSMKNPITPQTIGTQARVLHALTTLSSRVGMNYVGMAPMRFLKTPLIIPFEEFKGNETTWSTVNRVLQSPGQARDIVSFPDGKVALFTGATLHAYTPPRREGDLLILRASYYPLDRVGPPTNTKVAR